MIRAISRIFLFAWRISRNIVCAIPSGKKLLFPPVQLAQRFGRADTAYALHVYRHHRRQLVQAGFISATQMLETGPGRNLGSALLWWCAMKSQTGENVGVTLWDVHANADPSSHGFWRSLANGLIDELSRNDDAGCDFGSAQLSLLSEVAAGCIEPDIRYVVCSLGELMGRISGQQFDLVCSHAALEHVHPIERYWALSAQFTSFAGWHSHRIDLADHGRRDSNYVEMLEWPPLVWHLMTCFIPGTINRWRAHEHIHAFNTCGFRVVHAHREIRDLLPVPRKFLAEPYRSMGEFDLRTTALDLVGIKN